MTRSESRCIPQSWLPMVFVLLGMILVQAPVSAQVSCRAEVNRVSVPRGGEIVLTIQAGGEVGWSPEFQIPEMAGVKIYSGGTNQSMSMVNGQTQTSVTRTFFLQVGGTEDFTIPPVTIVSQGKQCQTEPISIEVTDAPAAGKVPPQDSGNRTQRPAAEPSPPETGVQAGQPGDEIFVTLKADSREAWVGQQIILTFEYWRRTQPWNNPQYTAPRTEGFWREDLGSERNDRKVLQGKVYNVTTIQYALFPTRSGDLVIQPAELRFAADVFDRFFNSRRGRQGPRVLKTGPVVIKVKDLPSPAPEGYSGIVATAVDLKTGLDRETVPRGEALELKIDLISDGFLKGFGGFDLVATDRARIHDGSELYSVADNRPRLIGRMEVEKILVPQIEGPFEIPEVALTWFDVRRQEYRTTRSGPGTVNVVPSDLPRPDDQESGFLRSEISRLSQDLAFIHPVPAKLSSGSGSWAGSVAWWTLALLPIVLAFGAKAVLIRRMAEHRDPAGRRFRLAMSHARRQLESGDDQTDSPDRLLAISRAICGFVADSTDRPAAAIGAEHVVTYAEELGCSEEGKQLAELVEQSEAARYGGVPAGDPEAWKKRAEKLLEALEAHRRSPGSSGREGRAKLLAWTLLIGMIAGIQVNAVPAFAQAAPGPDPVRLLAEGNQAYTEGDLDTALDRYLDVRRLGVNDPVLHFNLANTHARRGELGLAVAGYLRAARLDPRDEDIRTNLAWVRRHIKDLELAQDDYPLFIAQAAAVVRTLTLTQWGLALVVLVWILAGLLVWGWVQETFGSGLRRALLGAGGLFLVVAVITAGRYYHEVIRDQGVVIVQEADVRSGPAENFPVLFQVHDGLTLNIEERRSDWVRIGLGGQWVGWLPAGAVESVRLDPGI